MGTYPCHIGGEARRAAEVMLSGVDIRQAHYGDERPPTSQTCPLKSAKDRMDIISAYYELGSGVRGLPAHTALSGPRLGDQTGYPRRSYCPMGYTRTTESRRPKQLVSLHCHHSVDRSTQSQEVDLDTRSLAPPQWMQLGGAAPACTDRNTGPWAVGT